MDIDQLQKLGDWLGVAGAEPNLKVLERGVLTALALALPEDLSGQVSMSELVTRGMLGPAHVAREVILNAAANCEVCQQQDLLQAGAQGGEKVQQVKGSHKGSCTGDQQLKSSLLLVAFASRVCQPYLPEWVVLHLGVTMLMLVNLLWLLSGSQMTAKQRPAATSHLQLFSLLVLLYGIEQYGVRGEGVGQDVGGLERVPTTASYVIALLAMFLSSKYSLLGRLFAQSATLAAFLIGAYVPCLMRNSNQMECKLPTDNLLGISLCLTFCGLLSSAVQYQRHKSVIFQWRTKNGLPVSKTI